MTSTDRAVPAVATALTGLHPALDDPAVHDLVVWLALPHQLDRSWKILDDRCARPTWHG